MTTSLQLWLSFLSALLKSCVLKSEVCSVKSAMSSVKDLVAICRQYIRCSSVSLLKKKKKKEKMHRFVYARMSVLSTCVSMRDCMYACAYMW